MKWLIIITDWIKKETWWRKYYKKITLSDTDAWHGRCVFCDAGLIKTDIPRCSSNNKCPCKWNQCLRRINYERTN